MKLISKLLDLVYPPRCAFCHKFLESSGERVCRDCVKNLPYTKDTEAGPDIPNVKSCIAPLFYERYVRPPSPPTPSVC